ncbi:hypothetical protein L9F63_005476, partial [Diploptera punctata]
VPNATAEPSRTTPVVMPHSLGKYKIPMKMALKNPTLQDLQKKTMLQNCTLAERGLSIQTGRKTFMWRSGNVLQMRTLKLSDDNYFLQTVLKIKTRNYRPGEDFFYEMMRKHGLSETIYAIPSWSITLALSSAESPFSQTIKSKNEKRIFVPSTDRIRNLLSRKPSLKKKKKMIQLSVQDVGAKKETLNGDCEKG